MSIQEEVEAVKKTEQRSRTRRSPEDIGNDSDLAFKSTITFAMDRPTAIATRETAMRRGTTVSAFVRDAVVRILDEEK